MFRKRKFLTLSYSKEDDELRLFGDSKFVKGEIFIQGARMRQVFNFLGSIAWSRRAKRK